MSQLGTSSARVVRIPNHAVKAEVHRAFHGSNDPLRQAEVTLDHLTPPKIEMLYRRAQATSEVLAQVSPKLGLGTWLSKHILAPLLPRGPLDRIQAVVLTDVLKFLDHGTVFRQP